VGEGVAASPKIAVLSAQKDRVTLLDKAGSDNEARRRMRTESGGYHRDLAQRVEVDAKEIRIMGSKSALLRTLAAASSAKTAGFGVPSFVPVWRTRHDSNV
jgi:hypothetical protein